MTRQLQVEKLNPRAYKIMDLVLEGHSNVKIAELVGVTANHISVIVNSPCFQHSIAVRRELLTKAHDKQLSSVASDVPALVAQTLKEASLDAAKKMAGLLDSESEAIAARSAMDILDRTGHPRLQRAESKNLTATIVINSEDAERIKQSILLDEGD